MIPIVNLKSKKYEVLKRFMVFCGYDYYPKGGLEDFRFPCDTLQQALEYINENNYDWFNIFDTKENIKYDNN